MASATPAPRRVERAPHVPVHAEPVEAIWERTGSRPGGLTAAEAANRRGTATAPSEGNHAGAVLEEVAESLTEPLMLLLIADSTATAISRSMSGSVSDSTTSSMTSPARPSWVRTVVAPRRFATSSAVNPPGRLPVRSQTASAGSAWTGTSGACSTGRGAGVALAMQRRIRPDRTARQAPRRPPRKAVLPATSASSRPCMMSAPV